MYYSQIIHGQIKKLYTEKAKELALKFRKNFKKFANVSSDIIENGGPSYKFKANVTYVFD